MPEAALARRRRSTSPSARRLAEESRRVDAVWLSGRVDEANRMLAKLVEREAPLDARIRTPAEDALRPA